jgi:hypothetical protein
MQVFKDVRIFKEEIIGRIPGELLQGPESNPEVILYLNQIKKASLLIVRSLIIQKKRNTGCVFKDRLYMTRRKNNQIFCY